MTYGFTKQKCPKCGGNIYIDMDCYVQGDLGSWYDYESCLQCGYISYEVRSPLTEIKVTTAAVQKEPLLV